MATIQGLKAQVTGGKLFCNASETMCFIAYQFPQAKEELRECLQRLDAGKPVELRTGSVAMKYQFMRYFCAPESFSHPCALKKLEEDFPSNNAVMLIDTIEVLQALRWGSVQVQDLCGSCAVLMTLHC